MAKIIHNRKDCIGCGSCAAMCPGFFAMNTADGLADLKDGIPVEDHFELTVESLGCAEDAAMICPVRVIKVVEPE